MLRNFLLSLLLLFSLGVAAQKKSKNVVAKDTLAEINTFVSQMMADWKVPGVAICIVKNGKTILAKGYGERNIKTHAPVTENTHFGIASCSKSFTAACLSILADEGKLDWNKPVKEYMPDFQLYDEYATRNVTARELLSHRTGLPRHDFVWVNAPVTRQEIFERLKYLPPTKSVFAQYQYNNLMYMTAGLLVERLSGQTWEAFMRERILTPLRMNETVLTHPELFKKPDYALSYRDSLGVLVEEGFDSNVDAIGPAGAVKAPVTEMAHWLQMQLAKGQFEGKQVVSEKQLAETHTPQTVVYPAEAKYAEMGFGTYAMGWTLNTYRGHQRRQHGGAIEGYRSLMSVFPNDNLGIFITTNTSEVGYYFDNIITNFITDNYLENSTIDWNKRLRMEYEEGKQKAEKDKKENAEKRKQNTVPSHLLEQLAGSYLHPAYGTVEISTNGQNLYAKYHGSTFVLNHYHYDVFEGSDAFEGVKFSFPTNAKGDVEKVSVAMPAAGMEVEFKKKN